MSIWIVDDEVNLANGLKKAFEKKGYSAKCISAIRELQEALAQMPDGDLRGLLEERYLVGRSKRDLMERYCLSERSYYRRLTQAARCLDRCSTFFRAPF